jgi:hypothetical protein
MRIHADFLLCNNSLPPFVRALFRSSSPAIVVHASKLISAPFISPGPFADIANPSQGGGGQALVVQTVKPLHLRY